MSNNYNTPVTRNNLFYSEDDFQLETDWILDYIEQDTGQTVIVYQVDRVKTQINDIYQETKEEVRYKDPIEIPCLYEIADSQMKSYDSKTSNGVYSVSGNLNFDVLEKVLEKYDCDIKRGDYIGVLVSDNRMSYYVVMDDGKVNTSNKFNIGAYKLGWRKIICSPVTDEEFKGK